MTLTLTFTLTPDLYFQYHESYCHHLYTRSRSKVTRLKIYSEKQTGGRTDGQTEAIALPPVLTRSAIRQYNRR